MLSRFHFVRGFFHNFLSPNLSSFALISNSCRLSKTVVVNRGAKLKNCIIGDYTYVSAFTEINKSRIGRFCSIADHCKIGLPSHPLTQLSTSPIFTLKNNALKESWVKTDSNREDKPVIIANDVWIGSSVLIKGGVSIGNGAVIGAGAVVTKDVPSYAIVAGVPARIIRYRFDQDTIEKLESICWWNYPPSWLKENISIFQKEGISLDIIKDAFEKD